MTRATTADATAGQAKIGPGESMANVLATGLALRPHDPAILNAEESFTFAELDRLSNAAARYLRDVLGVRHGDRVVVIAEKALEIVPLAIAIWKAGAVYVPIDVANPPKRLEHILTAVEPAVVVSSGQRLREAARSLQGVPTCSYEELRDLGGSDDGDWGDAPGGESPAVIIHTSGSTGVPKGATLSHASVLVYFRNHNEFLRFTPASRGMNNGPFHFDVAIQDTFLPLYFGSTVVFHGGLLVSSVMTAIIRRERVTHLIAVSSVLDLISKDDARVEGLAGSALEVVVTGGEVCPPRLINRWLEAVPGIRVLYGYGPTELNSLCTTQVITEPEHGRQALYPIGKPFAGMKAILLDDAKHVIEEPGQVGVLAMTGPQLMLGYWRDPELTSRVLFRWQGEDYYVTGDRCFRDADGNYHFAGRRDTEVKIHGRRINLNEVRDALLSSEQVRLAVVTTVDVNGETRIAGFVNTTSVDELDEAALRKDVLQRVPDYMAPRHICVSASVARTSTGKVNEKEIVARVQAIVEANPNCQLLVMDRETCR